MISESSASALSWKQESDIRVQATSPSITSYSCVRSGVVTAYSAPNRSLLIRCSVRLVLINGSGFRHTIFRSITQLLNIFFSAKFLLCVPVGAVTRSCNGNHNANPKLLKLWQLTETQIGQVGQLAKFVQFWGCGELGTKTLDVLRGIASFEAILVDL